MGSTTHLHHVTLQRRVHETRRLLLEAADRLLDVDLALRTGDQDRALAARRQAAAITSAAQHDIVALDEQLPRRVPADA